MKRYIFAQRAGVHIIDLDQTLTLLDQALNFVRSVAEAKREILFVGTKKQAQIPLAEQAIRSGQPFIAERYIGGMLTNFQTILPRIQYFKNLDARVEETPEEGRTGKDWFALQREYQKLRRNFAGLTEMERLPGAVFVIDPKREELLIKEANRLKIPVIALTDTNCDPEVVDYVIPGNDDAIRAISLISRLVADAIVEGRGEEVPVEDRPVPPVIEEAQSSAEAQEPSATNGTPAAAEAPAEPIVETPEQPEGPAVTEAAAEPDAPTEPEAAPEVVAESAPEPEAVDESETAGEPLVEAQADVEPDAETPSEFEADAEPKVEEAGSVEDGASDDEENEGNEEK
jgi:small subunit ribosomal protein S2